MCVRKRCSVATSRTMSRNESASHRPRPRIACCRHGHRSPAASARIQPVLRRSSLSKPSRKAFAEAATRSCVNNGRIRAFTSRSDFVQNSSVASIDAPKIHDLRLMVTHRFRVQGVLQIKNATVMLRFRRRKLVAWDWLRSLKRRNPTMFAHWTRGPAAR